MNILLLGPQGSGKGTQARLLCDKFGFDYFESGAYLRRMAEIYPNIKKAIDAGKLVPDKEFTSYLMAYLDKENMYDNILFDGFPRNLSQYLFFRSWLNDRKVKLDLVFVLEISEDVTIKRLSARRQDPETGNIYNLITDPPPETLDKSKLIIRDDDKPEVIKVRLQDYKDRTIPLINELKKDTQVIEVNGEKPINEIQENLRKVIDEQK